MDYKEFLESKSQLTGNFGFEPLWIPDRLFDFQKHLTEWALRKGRGGLFVDTGLGKTLMQLVIAENVVKKTNGNVLILTPLAVAFQFIEEAKTIDMEIEHSKNGKFSKKIVVCNYERLHFFDSTDFEAVILDECFAPDTKIQVCREKKLYEVDIKDCKINDTILNCTGIDKIKSIKKRKIEYAIKIGFNGKEEICSPKHPWFTQRGWVPAKEIQKDDFIISSDKAMRILRGKFQSNIQGGYEEKILRDILLSEMENETARIFSKSPQSENCKEKRGISKQVAELWRAWSTKANRTNKKLESHAARRNEKKSICEIEGNKSQTFSAWGEWSRDDITTAIDQGCIVRRMDTGICYISGKITKGLSDKLQSRFSKFKEKNCNRSGWELSLFEKTIRQKEGRKTGLFGVESFEVLESGDIRLDKYRDEKGSLYFYDLEIERHPSFTVNGCLVHNSSILKNFDGAYKTQITEFMKKIKYRFLSTATPAPNDFIELGTSSEALGYLGYMDMLSKYFSNKENTLRPQDIGTKWNLKPHATDAFFKWVNSWAMSIKNPSDIGFSDDMFILPGLIKNYHKVKNETNLVIDGQMQMFNTDAKTITEVREEQKATIPQRCEKAAQLTDSHNISFVWCNFNEEGKLLNDLIVNSVEISGSDSIDKKEYSILWFLGKKCLCNTKEFSKLVPNWQKELLCGKKNTLKPEEKNTKNQKKKEPEENHKVEILMKTKTICQNIITETKKNLNLPTTAERKKTKDDGIVMQKIQYIENHVLKNLKDQPLQKQDLRELLKNMVSLMTIMKAFTKNKTVDAQYVIQKVQTMEKEIDYLLTIAIQQTESEDCFVQNATSESDNLEIIQNYLLKHPCTCGHESGNRRLISKSKIFGMGLNLQICNHTVYFPTWSYEQYYQAIRRFHRFGQKRPVTVDLVLSDGQQRVLEILELKTQNSIKLQQRLNDNLHGYIPPKIKTKNDNIVLPSFLK